MSLPAIALWKVGLRTGEYAKLRLFSAAFRGMSHEEFRSAGESFARKVEGITRSETVAALGNALREHRTVAIVSASCGDWIRPWAEGHGVRHVLATEVEVDGSGRLTGRFTTPNCRGEEKVTRILAAFPELRDRKEQCDITAYGDSGGDDAMLAFATNPVRV